MTDANAQQLAGRAFRCNDGRIYWVLEQVDQYNVYVRWLDEENDVWHDGQKLGIAYLGAVEEVPTPSADACVIRTYKGLPLTIAEVIARYLRQIADGPDCVEYLRKQGFDEWRDKFRASHRRYAQEEGGFNEWDSRDYTDGEMRLIYDGIVDHASRLGGPTA